MVNRKDANFMGPKNWIDGEWSKIYCEYPPSNVHKTDETGIYYCALLQYTYLFRNKDAKDCETSKKLITKLP